MKDEGRRVEHRPRQKEPRSSGKESQRLGKGIEVKAEASKSPYLSLWFPRASGGLRDIFFSCLELQKGKRCHGPMANVSDLQTTNQGSLGKC